MTEKKFNIGDRVTFKPSPRALDKVTATVTGTEKAADTGRGAQTFLVTKDDAGKERRIRPGSCVLAS